MKYSEEELEKLNEILKNYKQMVDSGTIPKLFRSYSKFYSSFNSFFSTLCSEKIITVDPYGNEYNLTELEPPEATEIPYNDEEYVISIRLSHLNSLFTYLKTEENILSLESLSKKKTQNIAKLLKFIHWTNIFDPQPEELNTEALNKVLFYYQRDRGQRYIISSLKASISDMELYANEIITDFEKINLFYDEEYKLWIRTDILPNIKLPPEIQGPNIKQAHDLISAHIKETKSPLYIELIGEILKEDFSSDGDIEKQEIIEKLSEDPEADKRNPKEKKEQTPVEMLEKSLIDLSEISTQIQTVIEKEKINAEKVREETYTIIEKVFDYIKYSILGARRRTIYVVEIIDPGETERVNREIQLETFLISLEANEKTLSKYRDGDSEEIRSLVLSGEEELEKELHKLLSKSRHSYKLLNSLDTFFRKNLKDPKGIKVELKVMLSAIDKSQAQYFEYKKAIDEKSTTYKPDKAPKA